MNNYNPEYRQDILNDRVESGDELKLVTDAQREAALERLQQLADDVRAELFGRDE